MIIQPRIRHNMCVNAHPRGCLAQVQAQIQYTRSKGKIESPRKVLVIGASNGFGLAARIVSAYASGAATIGIGFEKPPTPIRTGTAGWYNLEAFRLEAEKEGLAAWNINGDAFSDEVKSQTAELIREHLGQIDFLVYSIAAPRRMDPDTGEIYSSAIKPLGEKFTSNTVDFITGVVKEVSAPPASEEEVRQTVKVMGGEDWLRWIEGLLEQNLLAENFLTIAFSYIGPRFMKSIYRDGTMGAAKRDLEEKAAAITERLSALNGRALISVNKALITRASAIIPGVPLYISLLYRVMKDKKLHEGCIHQMVRMYHDYLFHGGPPVVDERGFIRMDDWEMREDVQREIKALWAKAQGGDIKKIGDIKGLREEFLRHHGFGMPGVDYAKDIDPEAI